MKHSLRLRPLLVPALLPLAALPLACASNPGEMTDEERIELYETTATYLYDDGALIRAQDQAVKVLELDPDNQEMRRMIGWIRLRLGSTEDVIIAEQFFTDLRRERDEHAATTLGLAIARERLGTAYFGTSRDYLDGTRTPREGEDPVARANELQEEAVDYWKDARKLYESTLEDGEGSTRSKNGLQRVCALLGDFEASLRWSDEVLTDAQAELVSWRRMLEGGDLNEEEEKLFQRNEDSARRLLIETHLFAASILNDLGRSAEAVDHLDAVIETDGRIAEVYSLRAQLRAKVGEYDLAIADIDQFLKLADKLPWEHPDVRRAFDLKAECEQQLGGEE